MTTTDEQIYDLLCATQSDLIDAYEKNAGELANIGAPAAVLTMLDEEHNAVMTELSIRIDAMHAKLFG